MENVIVYLDDAAHAQRQLAPGAQPGPVHWILVACAPRMTHRVSKWVSHASREHWRDKWADRLFEQVVPPLEARGDQVTRVLAKGPLPELTRQLVHDHGALRVLDMRRPRDHGGPSAAAPGGLLGTLFGTTFALALALD